MYNYAVANVAQLVEQLIRNQQVSGSIPLVGSTFRGIKINFSLDINRHKTTLIKLCAIVPLCLCTLNLEAIALIPQDQSIIYSKKINVEGQITSASAVFVNDQKVELTNHKFSFPLTLDNYGKNTIFITIFNDKGFSDQTRLRLLRVKPFKQASDHKLKSLIEILVTLEYLPENVLSQFTPDKIIDKTLLTAKNRTVWEKAIANELDQERFIVMLFKDSQINSAVSSFVDWENGYKRSYAVEWNPPVVTIPKVEPPKVKVIEPVSPPISVKQLPVIAIKPISSTSGQLVPITKDINIISTVNIVTEKQVKPVQLIKIKEPIKKKKEILNIKEVMLAPKIEKLEPTQAIQQPHHTLPVKQIPVPPQMPTPSIVTPIPVLLAQLIINEPQDKTIIDKSFLFIDGRLMNSTKNIMINEVPVKIARNGSFKHKVPLSLGKNLINIQVPGESELNRKIKVLRVKSYSDIAKNHWSSRVISNLGTLGVFPESLKFKPLQAVLREEMAVVLCLIKGEATPKLEKAPFRDVPSDYWAASAIKQVTDQELLGFYPDGRFLPKETVNRYQALVILSRLEGLNYHEAKVRDDFPFTDVQRDSVLASLLQAALDAKLITPAPLFNGGAVLTRSALASLISRLSIVKEQLQFLFDWDKGYE